MIKTLIIDDEELARRRIVNLLADQPDFEVIGEASSASDAIQLWKTHEPNLLFLDITLPDLDGFSIIESLPVYEKPLIIIVSGSEQHAIRAFDYQAFDYLLKPYKDQRFFEAIEKVKSKVYSIKSELVPNGQPEHAESNAIIPIKSAGKISFIDTDHIWYVEASGYYIEINAEGKKHLLRQSMGRIIQRLDHNKFIRIHRSVIINLQFMQEIVRSPNRDHLVKMRDGKLFKVSKSYKKSLFQRLNL